MFMPMLASSSKQILFSGLITRGYVFEPGVTGESWGWDEVCNVVFNGGVLPFGSATGKTALDGSGYTFETLANVYLGGNNLTTLAINTGGVLLGQSAVWSEIRFNNVTITPGAATLFQQAGNALFWQYNSDIFGLYALRQAGDVSVKPFIVLAA